MYSVGPFARTVRFADDKGHDKRRAVVEIYVKC